MSREMSPGQVREFLSTGTRTAKLAVTRADGRPMVTPVWFVLDGDVIVFMTGAETIKGKAIRRDGRVSICVDDETFPYAMVRVDGECSIGSEPDELLRWSTTIARRYVPADQVEAFAKRNAVPGELVIRVHPHRVVSDGDVTGW